jgi:hypothetical protein
MACDDKERADFFEQVCVEMHEARKRDAQVYAECLDAVRDSSAKVAEILRVLKGKEATTP